MRYHFFLHYGWFFQNLGKEAVQTFMHTTVFANQSENFDSFVTPLLSLLRTHAVNMATNLTQLLRVELLNAHLLTEQALSLSVMEATLFSHSTYRRSQIK